MKRDKEGKEISDEKEKKKGEPIQIQIDRIQIQRGSIDFEDRKVGEPPEPIRIERFRFRNKKYPIPSCLSAFSL